MGEKKRLKKIQVVLLLLSFLLITISSYFYLIKYTNFVYQGLSLIVGKDQTISSWIMWGFSIGLLLFGIFLSTSRRFLEVLWVFFIDGLTLVSGALLILGLFVPYRMSFRLGLIISAFIIYFVSYIARENVPKIIKFWNKKSKK